MLPHASATDAMDRADDAGILGRLFIGTTIKKALTDQEQHISSDSKSILHGIMFVDKQLLDLWRHFGAPILSFLFL